MVQGKSNGPLHQARIDTWKSIARYLGRSSRTVQRWHSAYGLPVHRLGGATGSIFAYADELDGWLRNRDLHSASTLVAMPRPAAPRRASQQPELRQDDRIPNQVRIPESRKAQSETLVAFARKLWDNLSHETLKLIAPCFREAIDRDPSNAGAFAGLSETLTIEGLIGNIGIPDA